MLKNDGYFQSVISSLSNFEVIRVGASALFYNFRFIFKFTLIFFFSFKKVKLTPQTIAAAFRQREERKGAMIEAAMAYSPNLKNRMAPPHPSSAKYSHITAPK